MRSVMLRCGNGAIVSLSPAAASHSEVLVATKPCGAVISMPFAAPALNALCNILELLADRFHSPSPHEAIRRILDRLPFCHRIEVLRAAHALRVPPAARLVSSELARVLRDRSPDVLRIVLGAADDLSPSEKLQALAEPVLAPPRVDDRTGGAILQYDPGSEESALVDTLSELDARSLRSLKAVSRLWQERARAQCGRSTSAWRQNPEWSAGTWARERVTACLASNDESVRKVALAGLEKLEAAVELPEFAPALLRQLVERDVCGASCRKLAMRALARLEPLTLALFAPQVRDAIETLEDFERVAPATLAVLQKLCTAELRPNDDLSNPNIAASLPGLRATKRHERDAICNEYEDKMRTLGDAVDGRAARRRKRRRMDRRVEAEDSMAASTGASPCANGLPGVASIQLTHDDLRHRLRMCRKMCEV